MNAGLHLCEHYRLDRNGVTITDDERIGLTRHLAMALTYHKSLARRA